MRAGSLFTGCGGLDLAIHEFFGAEPAWMCEADPHCRTVLERHWPGVPVLGDVREVDAGVPPVDVLHGGYPCQPFSVAGKRQGERDPRHLWPEFARLIRVFRPRLVLLENVPGHLALGFDRVLGDLAEAGYDTRWVCVRASDVGAPHRRERLFAVAYPERERWPEGWPEPEGREGCSVPERHRGVARHADDLGREGREPEPRGDARRAHRASADAGRERHDRRGRLDERSAAGARDGRAGAPGYRAPAADADTLGRGRGWPRSSDGAIGTTLAERGGQPSGRGEDAADPRGVGLSERAQLDGRATEGTAERRGRVSWGVYEPAIRQWERILGRPAPRPTDDRGRLMPEFVEWMMALPEGWTEGVARTHRLRMLGNAVVWPQAVLALGELVGGATEGDA